MQKQLQQLDANEMEQVSGGFSDALWGAFFSIGSVVFENILSSLTGFLSRR